MRTFYEINKIFAKSVYEKLVATKSSAQPKPTEMA